MLALRELTAFPERQTSDQATLVWLEKEHVPSAVRTSHPLEDQEEKGQPLSVARQDKHHQAGEGEEGSCKQETARAKAQICESVFQQYG